MDRFVILPETLLGACLGSGERLYLQQHIVAYILDIAQITALRRPYQLDCPAYLKDAATSRLDEFFAGRIVAEAILRQHFCCYSAVTSKTTRLPIWPQGLSGCISHTQDKLLVIVSEKYQYIGVDLQSLIMPETAQQIATLILTPSEQQLGQGLIQQGLDFTQFLSLIFSMKESLYKAVYPVVQTYIDFLEVELTDINIGQQTARFEFCSKIQRKYPILMQYQAQWQWHNGNVISYVLH